MNKPEIQSKKGKNIRFCTPEAFCGLCTKQTCIWGLAISCHRFRLQRGILARSLLRLKHSGKKIIHFKREESKKTLGLKSVNLLNEHCSLKFSKTQHKPETMTELFHLGWCNKFRIGVWSDSLTQSIPETIVEQSKDVHWPCWLSNSDAGWGQRWSLNLKVLDFINFCNLSSAQPKCSTAPLIKPLCVGSTLTLHDGADSEIRVHWLPFEFVIWCNWFAIAFDLPICLEIFWDQGFHVGHGDRDPFITSGTALFSERTIDVCGKFAIYGRSAVWRDAGPRECFVPVPESWSTGHTHVVPGTIGTPKIGQMILHIGSTEEFKVGWRSRRMLFATARVGVEFEAGVGIVAQDHCSHNFHHRRHRCR